MWCKHCNLETNETKCPVCGTETEEDLPIEIFWCKNCNIPLIHTSTAADRGICPVCGKKTHYLTTDLRPVFPEEKLLLALLLDKEPSAYMDRSVWAVNSRYYIDGKALTISVKDFEKADTDAISKRLDSVKTCVGKPDPEIYVDSGKWKARQGGNGLASAGDVKIRFTNCTTEDHAKIYRLVRPFDDELTGMFVPFGRVAPELGKKLLRETIILDARSNVPILSIQPFNQNGYDYAVKVRTMNVADHDDLQRMVGYQIRKFNACTYKIGA